MSLRLGRRVGLATALALAVAAVAISGLGGGGKRALSAPAPEHTPIRHVVVVYQENHSFDNVLGRFCADVNAGTLARPGLGMGCDGATTGRLPNGTVIPLRRAGDEIPMVDHSVGGQQKAINGGAMDGFANISGCHVNHGYRCYQQYFPKQIPNLASLAEHFALSDRTFEMRNTPSWAGHLQLAAASIDGFFGNNPQYRAGPGVPPHARGWGCNSSKEAQWGPSRRWVPSCVPDPKLNPAIHPNGGAFAPTPVPHIPTIFDRLQAAHLSWRLYAGDGRARVSGYGWTMCPSFADCLYTRQDRNVVPAIRVLSAARAGTLPAFSIVTPTGWNSQHNLKAMAQGDDWIGRVLSAIMHGPQWTSTAVFITYDDCGCFYDHVNPLQYNPSWGIRVPMVIVSPWARAGYTDSTPTTYAGILAFVEHTFGLRPLNSSDATAYDFSNSFDFSQAPLPPIRMMSRIVPRHVRVWVRKHEGQARQDT